MPAAFLPLEKAQPDPWEQPCPAGEVQDAHPQGCPAGSGVQLETPTPGQDQPLQAPSPDSKRTCKPLPDSKGAKTGLVCAPGAGHAAPL